MARRTSFIYTLYLLSSFLINFSAGEVEYTINHCCSLGSSTATRDHHCNGISISTPVKGVPPETQSVCFSAMQLCCVHDLRTIECEEGKEAAKSGRNCPDNNTDQKLCCEACKLGIISSSMGVECNNQDINFGCPWNSAYEACCSMNDFHRPDITQNFTHFTPPNQIPDQNICELYPGELCAHICEPNLGSYICRCHDGFTLMEDGKTCQQNTIQDRCTINNPCQQQCRDTGVSIECSCESGYRLHANNKSCFDIDECSEQSHLCRMDEMCFNEPGKFRCEPLQTPTVRTSATESTSPVTTPTSGPELLKCPVGYLEDTYSHQCVDVDECKENIHLCQRETEDCLNLNGGYKCVKKSPEQNCNTGFKWNPATQSCTDKNECEEIEGDNPCDSNQICENTVGSYKCRCRTGYQLDSITQACVDINECQVDLDNCLPSQRCDNTIGSFQCVRYTNCGTGYTLNAQTGLCEDDDECLLKIDNCRYLGSDFICRNTLGSFRCERKHKEDCDGKCPLNKTIINCQRGYQVNSNGQCEDIDECEKGLGRCPVNQKCVNIKGSYTCQHLLTCDSGLRMNEARTQCTDVNECLEYSRICDHVCINTWGSYRCSCQPGYKLHEDNRTCVDLNECELFKDRRLCTGYCVNQPGSYSCQCPQGYILGNDGASCQDIDECKTGNVCTGQDEACLNMRGSYRCNSIACPPDYIKDIQHKNRCKKRSNTCREGDTECMQQPLTYSFYFITLVSNYTVPPSGLDLFTMRGPIKSSTTVDFVLNLKMAHVPPRVQPANDNYFLLSPSGHNQVVIKLVQTLLGPQDIQLELTTTFYYNGLYSGKAVSRIGLFVSQYEF